MACLPLEELARRFVSCTLPRAEWTHEAHLRVGAWHVHRYGGEEALRRLRSGIRRLNDRHGTVNSSTSGYHETITVAYVRLIEMYLAVTDGSLPLERKVERLVRSPLGARDFLLALWSRDLLLSERARAAWTPPDLAPLALPGAREEVRREEEP